MTRPIFNRLRATVALPPLPVAIATAGVPAQLAHASDHTITLMPTDAAWEGEMFQKNPYANGNSCDVGIAQAGMPLADATLRVGYTHSTITDPIYPDVFTNCVYQTAVRFDLSPLRQYPDAIVTRATLSYWDQMVALGGPDGEPISAPYGILENVVAAPTCVYQLRVPQEDWRGGHGVIHFTTPDDTLVRTGIAMWDVINQVRSWYSYPDSNVGLFLAGFDEGRTFSNNAQCVSTLSNVQLDVDFVASDAPAPPPPPPIFDGAAHERNLLPPTKAVAPLPPPPPSLPDLLVAKVEVKGKNAKQANVCQPGDNSVTATIKNDGGASAVETASSVDPQIPQIQAALLIDGKERMRTVTFILHAGEERNVAFEALKLDKGTHVLQVVIDPDNRVTESDKTNNTFTETKLVCK